MNERRKIEVFEDSIDKLHHRYASALVRGDYLAEENKRLRDENEALRKVEHYALHYIDAASDGGSAERLRPHFENLVRALGWRSSRSERVEK